jgi:tRNA(Ile)-lysidine synthase
VQELHKSVLAYVRSRALIRAGDRVCVAVSGGADSVALLRLLLDLRSELGIVLSVAHLNHNLRGADSDADSAFVAALAAGHELEFHQASEDVRANAAEHSLSLEAAGRRLREQFFANLLRDRHATRIATAHTADDQAETVLLRLLRGAGPRGMAGILPSREPHVAPGASRVTNSLARQSTRSVESSIIRPLLSTRRAQLRDYLRDIAQPWREDASNSDLAFARNRVRAELLPLLERNYNPSLVDTLAATAEIARAEEEFWDIELARLLPTVLTPAGRLRLPELVRQSLATQRRLVRLTAGTLDFERVEQVLDFARRRGRAERTLPLPGGRVARFAAGELWFETSPSGSDLSTGYHYRLPVPGEVCVRELNRRITASLLPLQAAAQGYNPQQFLDPSSLASELSVRNWRAGDRFWPLHGKAPRKLKELLPRVPARERSAWPVVVSGDEIVWVRGLAVAHDRSARRAKEVVVIEETPA